MHLFFSAGEPSGDQHGAELIGELRSRIPQLKASGFGGPKMRAAGCELLFQLTDLAVMGLIHVIPLLGKFIRLRRQAARVLESERPDAVILIDFPGFNWGIAKSARALGIPVFFYMPPQLWAWAPWRIRKIRRSVDHVLCGLPFEHDWYRNQNVDAHFVGHPFFDEVAEKRLDNEFLEAWKPERGHCLALLPGSRDQEVTRNWPLMVDVCGQLFQRQPRLRMYVACFSDEHRRACESFAMASHPQLPMEFFVGKTSEIVELADCTLMVSGSVSLEMLARVTPSVVVYRAPWTMYLLAKALVTCKYISLPNLIADRVVMPEFPCVGRAESVVGSVTEKLTEWLTDPRKLAAARTELEELRRDAVRTGAVAEAANTIVAHVQGKVARAA